MPQQHIVPLNSLKNPKVGLEWGGPPFAVHGWRIAEKAENGGAKVPQ